MFVSHSSHKRKDISLRLLDQIVEKPASIRRYLKENRTVEVNEIFNVTPHSVEGMEWTSNMLQRACSKHLTESVEWLLDNGADPSSFRDNVEDINSIPPITLCILHAISPKSRAAAIANIKLLVAYGAYLNHETECSSFPLECAASIITPRSPRDTWDLSMCLVELGAHTRHLAPNMFSAPPETLVRELRRLEKERQASMKGALAFTLQCTGVLRTNDKHCATTAASHSNPCTHSEALSAIKVETPLLCQSPFKRLSQGPFSQMGLVPSAPPTQTSSVLPLRSVCTPTPPRRHVLPAYVYSTPKGPKNISRKRSFAQIPWAPILKHKAKKRRVEKVPARAPAPTNAAGKSIELTEFATPQRSVGQITSQHNHTPSHMQARRRQRISSNFSSVQVSADVQRIILDFALPISHTPHRKARINTVMAMKSKRDRGQALSSWFSTKSV